MDDDDVLVHIAAMGDDTAFAAKTLCGRAWVGSSPPVMPGAIRAPVICNECQARADFAHAVHMVFAERYVQG